MTSNLNAGPATVVWKTDGSITFASADGGDVWLIDATGGLSNPTARLMRVNADGATLVTTVKGYAYSPVADATSIYLVANHDVVRVDKRPPHALTTLAKDEVWPFSIAVDNEHVYFTNQTTIGLDGGPRAGKPGSVAKMKKNGGAVKRLSKSPATHLVPGTDDVYVTSEDSVRAVGKSGGRERTLVADTGSSPSLALDGEWLVYTRHGGASRVHTKSGKIEPLVDGIDIPLFVAAANGVTYLAANFAYQGPGQPPKPAEVLRLRPGTAPERLWSGMNRVSTLVIANGKVFFTIESAEGSSLLRID